MLCLFTGKRGEAQSEIEKATEIIQQTFLSVNYNNIDKIFNVSDTILIEESKKLELLPPVENKTKSNKR